MKHEKLAATLDWPYCNDHSLTSSMCARVAACANILSLSDPQDALRPTDMRSESQ